MIALPFNVHDFLIHDQIGGVYHYREAEKSRDSVCHMGRKHELKVWKDLYHVNQHVIQLLQKWQYIWYCQKYTLLINKCQEEIPAQRTTGHLPVLTASLRRSWNTLLF